MHAPTAAGIDWLEHAGWAVLAAGAGGAAGFLVHAVVAFFVARVALRSRSAVGQTLARHARAPSRVLFTLLGVQVVLLSLREPGRLLEALLHINALALIAATAWLVVGVARLVDLGVGALLDRNGPADDLRARRLQTRVRVVRRVIVAVVWIVALASMLMTFPRAWQLGASLLASAGIVGLAAGIAARPVLANLIAGVQIAITQPIRLEDAVVIDGVFGWVEEITSTYVVLRGREGRRTILPVTFFVERSYENWTRVTHEVVAAATVVVDRATDVGRLRADLRKRLEASELWDRRVWGLEVAGVLAAGLELRATMSAVDAASAWALQAQVREWLVEAGRAAAQS